MKDDAMTSEEMIRLCKAHTMYAWAKGDAVDPLPIERAEGVWLYTPDGKKILDFNSQLMCVNIGHGHPKVVQAIAEQAAKLCYVYPGTATAVRARVSQKLAALVPGDINTFFFTLGGAEANENAIKAARLFTGRHKILSRYRSYHGGTNATSMLTGDPRRWASEPGMPGVVHVLDPSPYDFVFGTSDAEIVEKNLAYLEEVIMCEGPHTIAAMFVETVTGSNGVLPPPDGYLQGLRKLLDRHGILLVCDEVMAGFGRTGKMFAFEHWDIVPDIVTMAKGLTSAYLPLGAMGVSDRIAEHFKKNVFWGGLTYNSHALALATAEAVMGVMEEERLVENAARLGPVMQAEMNALRDKHPSVKEGRALGLFGMVDLQKNSKGEALAPYNGAHPAMAKFNRALLDAGLFTFVRWGSFMCNPPLCITEAELKHGFAIIDRALEHTDAAFEG
jgi:taurine--2-oxoglutarate transaminase